MNTLFIWRVQSATATKRPQGAPETGALIKRVAAENRLWGAERIIGLGWPASPAPC